MIVRGALPHEMDTVREHVEGWCARSLGRWDPDRIMLEIAARDRQAWVAASDGDIWAVAMTRVEPPVVYLDACSGRVREAWADALDATLTKWAHHVGAERIICFARLGWRRTGERLGWRATHVEMVKELDHA